MKGGASLPLLVFLAVVLAASALAAGWLEGNVWGGELILVVAVGFGFAAGTSLARFWRGGVTEALGGSGGAYLLFLAGVLFTAAEAYAVGQALAEGAPPLAAALALPPLVVAGYGLLRCARLADGLHGSGPGGNFAAEQGRRSDGGERTSPGSEA